MSEQYYEEVADYEQLMERVSALVTLSDLAHLGDPRSYSAPTVFRRMSELSHELRDLMERMHADGRI